MSNKNLRRISVLVTAQTAYNLKKLADAVRAERDATIMQDRYEKEKFERIR